MSELLYMFAAIVLLAIAVCLLRIAWGPTTADRMMGAQLASTGGIAVLLMLAVASDNSNTLDVALVLALLAAFTVVGFAKLTSSDGAGDPEEQEPW